MNGEWKRLIDKKDKTIWKVKKTHPEYVNIIRSIILREIPSLSFDQDDKMDIVAHRLVLTKEQIAKHIESLPIHYPPTNDEFKIVLDVVNNTQIEQFLTTDDCMFTLNGKKVDPKYKVPYNIEPMPLYKNQQIKIVAIAVKGKPKDNAKFKCGDSSFEANDDQNVFDFWIESHRKYQTPNDILKIAREILKDMCEEWYKSIIKELKDENLLEITLPINKNMNQFANLLRYRILEDPNVKKEIINCKCNNINVMKSTIDIYIQRRENSKTNFKQIIRKVLDGIK